MPDVTAELRELAAALLRENKADVIVGYEEGSLPLRTTPCFAYTPEGAKRLVWNACCENNLVTYLLGLLQRDPSTRIGVVAKGCDGRSIAGSIVERQVPRESVYIIAVPCEGVVDRAKLQDAVGDGEITEGSFANGEVLLSVEGTGASSQPPMHLPVDQLLCDACGTCAQRIAPIHDVLVGERAPEIEVVDDFEDVKTREGLPTHDRWVRFSQEYGRCIRCYACREACPLCYCTECFVDQTGPEWTGRTDDLSDTLLYHLIRTLHLAGRCVDCGACSRACPEGIDLRYLNRKMIRESQERFGFRAGMDPETAPPLSTFRADDPQEFIK